MLAVLQRNPQFKKLWFAQVVSSLGDWISRIAILALIERLGGGGEKVLGWSGLTIGVGMLYAFEYAIRLLPTTTFSSLAGPLADRLPRRSLMITADVLRALIVLSLLFIQEPAHLPWLYAIIFMQMSVGIFFDSARSGALPNTVAKEDLHMAFALSAATFSTMFAFGSFAGGVLVTWIGSNGVFLVDAGTYALSAYFLIGLRLPATPKQPEPFRLRDVVMLTDLRRGFAHTRNLGIWPILFSKVLWSPCGGFVVLFPLLARRFDTGKGIEDVAATIGLLFMARGIGTGIGPLLAKRFMGSKSTDLIRQTWLGCLVGALGYCGLVFAPTLPLCMLAICIAHIGGSAQWVGSTLYWQHAIDDGFRGRVFACEFALMTLSFSVFAILGGYLYDTTGSLETAFWVLIAFTFLGSFISRSWFKRLPTRAAGR